MGTADEQIPYFSSLLLGVSVLADGNSQLEGLSDVVATTVFNAYEGYGWIVPASLLVALFLGVLYLFCIWLDNVGAGLDLDFPVIESVRGIIRWTREKWREGRGPCTHGL